MTPQTCVDCGDSVAWGSGKFVNRVPATDGWICADCQAIECDHCGEPTTEWDHPVYPDHEIWCQDCIDKVRAAWTGGSNG